VTSDGRALAVKAEWRTAAVSANVATNAWPWLQDVLAAVVAMVLILCSSSLVCRRLLGSHVSWPHRYSGRDVLPDSPSTVIYYRSDSPDIDAVIARITAMINLATDARFASVQPLTIGPGTYRFDDLDLAVIEPARRVQILAVLERLIDRHDVELIITANRSPLRRLHRPEMYPEFRPGDEAGYAELIRWDSVMGRFRELLQPAVPPSQAALPTAKLADFHRTWKLCTRDERLILHQLATGKLANPEHADTIGILIRYGLVCVDPLPRICDPDFSRFVRTAEAPGDIALWQHEASRSTWKSLRAPVVAGLMLLVLMLVVWFSWAGGESFKVFSTVIMAAVALLGHLTNAFNFVRGPASKT
jgi:hypothetical protein